MKAFFLRWYKLILLVFVVILMMCLIVLLPGDKKSSEDSSNKSSGESETSALQDEGSEHADSLDELSLKTDEGETIFLIPQEDIKSFSITEANNVVLNFERDGDEWIYVEQPDIRFNQDRLGKILNYISDIRSLETIEAENGEEYGLTRESKEYAVADYAGNTIVISLGSVDESTGNVYYALNYDFTTIFVNSGRLNNVSEYSIEELVEH